VEARRRVSIDEARATWRMGSLARPKWRSGTRSKGEGTRPASPLLYETSCGRRIGHRRVAHKL
jgi:hypothetical protein